jgi:predicted ArsR family transcriptional regulator
VNTDDHADALPSHNARTQNDDGQSPISAIALLGEPTRRRLYEFVASRDGVGRDAASAALAISRELAAFHLDKLVEGGLLETSYRRLSGRTGPGAGRPAKLYKRSTAEIDLSVPPRNYGAAAKTLAQSLEILADSIGDEAVAEAVTGPARARGLTEGAAVRQRAGIRATRERKREELARRLAEDGFEPRMDPQTKQIALGNCPYRQLSDAHRELTCGMNLAWAQGVVDGVRGVGYKPHLEFQPGRCCVSFQPA